MPDLTQIKELLRNEFVLYEKARTRFRRKIIWHRSLSLFLLSLPIIIPIFLIWGRSRSFEENHVTEDIVPIIFPIVLGIVLFTYIMELLPLHIDEEEKKDFEQKVKAAVFKKVLKSWNSSASYTSNSSSTKKLATKTFLKKQFQHPGTEYTRSDHCQGVLVDGRRFFFSKLLLEEQAEEHTSSGHTIRGTRSSFEGLFLVVENSSPFIGFEGRLSIFPKKEDQSKKQTNLSLQLLQLQQAKKLDGYNTLDANFHIPISTHFSPKELFDQEYTLIGKNNHKKQLSDSFYQVVEWKELLDGSIYLQFIGKDCYLLVDHLQDFLEVSIARSFLDKSYIQRLAQEFHTIFSFIEKIVALTQKN